MRRSPKQTPEDELIELIGSTYADFGKYLRIAYQWGEIDGPLSRFDGPENWVMEVADDISNQVAKNRFDGANPVPTIYVSIGSGNGCAKSAFAGMINAWIMQTRAMSLVTVTANTGTQLKTKTWPEISKWMRLSIAGHWFDIAGETIKSKEEGDAWMTALITWNLQNTTAFAGQHRRESSSAYIYDESARIPEAIMAEADGGLTDGEPFWVQLGNTTTRSGRLFRACFGDLKWRGEGVPPPGEFISRTIDSRTCKYTNKALIDKWIRERGEDSDWVRGHVKGEPPNAGDLQYIDNLKVQYARRRPVPDTDGSEPLRMSIDFARGGSANNVIGFRRGRDARSIPALRIPGEKTRDTMRMVSVIMDLIGRHKPDIVFGDATGLGGPIMDRLRQLTSELPIIDVVNGATAPDDREAKKSKYGNTRAYCWGEMREWLAGGCIEDHIDLETDLTGPEYWHNKHDQTMLESKEDMEERDLASPDWGDQLAMTFFMKYVELRSRRYTPQRPGMMRPSGGTTSGRPWMRK